MTNKTMQQIKEGFTKSDLLNKEYINELSKSKSDTESQEITIKYANKCLKLVCDKISVNEYYMLEVRANIALAMIDVKKNYMANM